MILSSASKKILSSKDTKTLTKSLLIKTDYVVMLKSSCVEEAYTTLETRAFLSPSEERSKTLNRGVAKKFNPVIVMVVISLFTIHSGSTIVI